jgi:hypothetical protein
MDRDIGRLPGARARAAPRSIPRPGVGPASKDEPAVPPSALAVELSRVLPAAGRGPSVEAELRRIDEQLSTSVINDEYRAVLTQRRSRLLAGDAVDGGAQDALAALAREAALRQQASASGASTAGPGPSSVTVPLTGLLTVPEPIDVATFFAELAADPGGERGQELASRYVINRYLAGKLDWPVQVDLFDSGGQIWFVFSLYGEELIASRVLDLPLTALDVVSAEPLATVMAEATQLVEVASLEAAAADIVATIGDLPEAMIANPERFARNEAVGLRRLADRYLARVEAILKALYPSNESLRGVLAARHEMFVPLVARVRRADKVTNAFHNSNRPATYAGETYDELVSESSGVERAGWWIWRALGNAATLGGQSLSAQNARMYRSGEISLDEYEKNWVLNFGRVGVAAAVTALTAGRATGPAMRFLGLEAGTSAAAVVAGGVEGVATGFTQAFSADLYAKIVATVSSSPGVAAFHEQTIGGPEAWAESAAVGGMFGMGGALVGHTVHARLDKHRADVANVEASPVADAPDPTTSTLDQPGPKVGKTSTGSFADIDRLIAEELMDIGDVSPGSRPLVSTNLELPPTAQSFREALDAVDLTAMTAAERQQLDAGWARYSQRANRAIRSHDDYVRFVYGKRTRQLAKTVKPSTGQKSIEAEVAIEAGRAAEAVQGVLRNTTKNNAAYDVTFFDPVRLQMVSKTVIPDFMPTTRTDSAGRFLPARDAADALVIADSKFTWDAAKRITLDDQIRAMMVLAQRNNKPFVFLVREGGNLSSGVHEFARAIGVEIHTVQDVSGLLR